MTHNGGMSIYKQPAFWRLAFRMLWRDLKAGELRLLLTALALAVAALSAVAFFSSRLDAALRRDAAQLLGGDLVISGDNPLPARFADKAVGLGLQTATTQTFPTMARAPQEKGGGGRLVYLKAVSGSYPLRGTLFVSQDSHWQPGAPETAARQPPQSGQVWVEALLLEALGLQVGDAVLLGNATLRIERVLTQEPDRGGAFVSLAPRVLMHASDLPATALVQPASRVNYRLALTGSPGAVRAYAAWAKAQTGMADASAVRVHSLEEDNPRMQETLARASSFLNLVALLAALLSAVAVVLGARSFAARHLDGCAMLRVLGLRQRTIALAYGCEFMLVGLAGSVLGVLAGYGMHYAFVAVLGDVLRMADLPLPGVRPALLGIGVGMALLLAFGMPPVLQMADTPALHVIRRELGRIKPLSVLVVVAGAAGFAALLLVASADLKMGAIAVGGFAAALALFVLLGVVAVLLLQRLAHSDHTRYLPQGGRLAIRQLGARPGFVVVQISSLCLGLMALVLLVIVRTDLVQSWRNATPPDAYNRYVINILPEQAQDVQQALHDGGVTRYDWYPMVRGRLVAVNGQPVHASQYADDRAQRLVQREFNLSYSAALPAWNPVTQGMWRSGEADGISMEEGIMKTLGLRLGDRVVFDMAGVQRANTITSVRKVNWASMHVNFFAMYPLASLEEGVAQTYITAYHAPPRVAGRQSLDARLLQAYPNVTQVDMDSTLHQAQMVLEKVIRAIELLFGFGLAAGVLVLFATLASTREERAHEFAIMRALGARSALLQRIQNAELLVVGALSGLFAGAVALAIGWVLAHYVFEFEWTLAWQVLPVAVMAGALLAWLAGRWSLRNVLRQPVVQSLRTTV